VTDEQAVALVTRLICRSRHLDPSQVLAAESLSGDLGFDSLDAAELLATLHKETGRQLSVDSIKDIQTVRGIAKSLMDAQE